MSIWELFLTAVALSMDAMAVAVSAGLSNAGGKGVKFREAGLMGLFFGVFQAVMPLLGYYIIPLLAMIFGSGVTRFVEGTDHWIAFVLLAFIGGKMLWDVFHEKVLAASYVINGFGKTTGLVQIDELGTLETPILFTNTLSKKC